MHSYHPTQAVLERAARRRGECDTRMSADDACLVVVDMQNYFVSPSFATAVPAAGGIIAPINQVARALRRAGGRVVWLRTTSEGALEHWGRHHSFGLNPGGAARRLAGLAPGSPGYQLHEDLDVGIDDLVLDKIQFSALARGSSTLANELEKWGIQKIFVAGTLTNVCCDSTARDAMMQDYRVAMLSDANAALTEAEHSAALDTFQLFFGQAITTEEAIAMW